MPSTDQADRDATTSSLTADLRVTAAAEGFELLATNDDCPGEARIAESGQVRIAYGWSPNIAERNARVARGLAAARTILAGRS
jgi:hypothetical protein